MQGISAFSMNQVGGLLNYSLRNVVVLKSVLMVRLLSPSFNFINDEKGVLVSGKGTRFILANTEQLHSKIQEMSDRIRTLEDALQAIHSEHASHPDQPHPLMQPALLGIKSTMGLYSAQTAPSEDRTQAAMEPNHSQQHGTSQDKVMIPEYPIQVSKISQSQANPKN